MELATLLNKPVRILTIPEYVALKKEYFTTTGNENTVFWIFCPSGYRFFTKHKTLEDVAKIYWKHEPLLKRYMSSEEECLSALKKSHPDGIVGVSFRWLPGNMSGSSEVCYQPNTIRPNNIEAYIDDMSNTELNDHMFGMLLDPYVFVKELALTDDEYIDDDAPCYKDNDDYRVFCMEITKDDYDKMEAEYVASYETGKYNDGLLCAVNYKNFEMSEEFKKFFFEHTHYPD